MLSKFEDQASGSEKQPGAITVKSSSAGEAPDKHYRSAIRCLIPMFKVQRKMCETCIYRPDSPLDLVSLEAAIADKYGGFTGHRICHHSDDACCAGFWAAHKDEFQLGQVAQRLNFVEFVDVDTLKGKGP